MAVINGQRNNKRRERYSIKFNEITIQTFRIRIYYVRNMQDVIYDLKIIS